MKIKDIPKVDRPREKLAKYRSEKLSNSELLAIYRSCAICGENILIKLDDNDNYTGGHYFGKIPLSTNKEYNLALKAGTTKERWGKIEVEILKKDPKPYKHIEYWECNKCYFSSD